MHLKHWLVISSVFSHLVVSSSLQSSYLYHHCSRSVVICSLILHCLLQCFPYSFEESSYHSTPIVVLQAQKSPSQKLPETKNSQEAFRMECVEGHLRWTTRISPICDLAQIIYWSSEEPRPLTVRPRFSTIFIANIYCKPQQSVFFPRSKLGRVMEIMRQV